jgi:hypothetical protein
MKQLIDLRFLFRTIALVEAIYGLLCMLTPPSKMLLFTGSVLGADGQWLAKLVGATLVSQAWVAWVLRNEPHRGVAKALAFYQLAAATINWVMWTVLADQGIFSTALSRVSGVVSILFHYTLGILLVLAIRRHRA